jgi:hypothetical protein
MSACNETPALTRAVAKVCLLSALPVCGGVRVAIVAGPIRVRDFGIGVGACVAFLRFFL